MRIIRLFIKRLFDIIASLLGIVILLPVYIIVAIMIKIDSKGPIIFKQERIGKKGKIFNIYKFRTMVINAENIGDGVSINSEDDPRITKVGSFLRKTSLDELPQLINVLIGQMSIIGPRPPVTYVPYKGYENYPDEFKKRFNMRPGITGHSQVIQRNDTTWEDRIYTDLEYINKFTLFLDFKILFKTFVSIFKKQDIYTIKKNILILSAGTRNKIVQYFKKELKDVGLVIATDNSELAPAIYDADRHYIVPKITDPNYLDIILDICDREDIKGVFSLIDPELELLAKNKQLFLDNGVTPIISDLEAVSIAFNKYEMYLALTKHNIPTIKTYNSLEVFYDDLNRDLISFPVFVKPNKGSASKGIGLVETKEDLELRFRSDDDLIIQEYMTGYEYGADVYIDLIDNKPKALFLKKKLLMRAGETDKSVSLRHREIENMIFKMLKHIPFRGIIDVDVFEHNNKLYISEVNPRFGGGYPHGYETGVNIPKMIINNLEDNINDEVFDYEEGIYMMKYNEVSIKRD